MPHQRPAFTRCARRLLIAPICALALLVCAFGPPLLTDSDHDPTLRIHPGVADPAAFAASVAAVNAPSAIVYDLESGRTLFARAADAPRPPASLTKLMTALLAMERAPLEETVTVQGVDLIGNSSMGLQAGETLTLHDLLWGLLLPSGNDAAMTIARAVGGDPDTFVTMMNARAQALNLSATHFMTPHGLDADAQTSSALDLLQIALLDWQQPIFRTIVGSATATIAGHPLKNTNEILGPLDGNPAVTVIGVKTGTTDHAGECLVAAFEQAGRVTFVVILGSNQRFSDAKTLYAATRARYVWFTPRAADFAALNRAVDAGGQMHYLQGSGAPALLLDAWLIPLLRPLRILDARDPATWTPNMRVGRIEWRVGSQLLATEQLVVR